MASVTLGVLEQELDGPEPDDLVGNLVHHAGELALGQEQPAFLDLARRAVLGVDVAEGDAHAGSRCLWQAPPQRP